MRAASPLHFETDRLPPTLRGTEEVEVTLLCADVVAFTEMTERLGDQAALRVMRHVARTLRDQASSCQGELLEIRGDAFLVAFEGPRCAVRFALRVMRSLVLEPRTHGGECVQLRMGLHAGRVIKDGGGYFGRCVILAYRLLSQAGAGCIAMTAEVAQGLPDHWHTHLSQGGRFRPKGFGEDVRYVLLGADLVRSSVLVDLATREAP